MENKKSETYATFPTAVNFREVHAMYPEKDKNEVVTSILKKLKDEKTKEKKKD